MSTLLRIMAGGEETSSGEAQLTPGATVGLLEQEPELDASCDVRGNVEDGVRELRDLLDCFNAISVRFAGRGFRCAPRRAGRRCRRRSTAATRGRSTRRSTARWTRCECRTAIATPRRSRG